MSLMTGNEDTIVERQISSDVPREEAGIPRTESTELTRYDPLRRYMAEIGEHR